MARQRPSHGDRSYSVPEALGALADVLSDGYGLDPARVLRILERTVRDGRGKEIAGTITGRVTQKRGLMLVPNLRDALLHASDRAAILDLFERGNLRELAQREAVIDYLTFGSGTPLVFTPFYTLRDLERRTRGFIAHLKRNRRPLLETGFPRTDDSRFPWLDWHLTKLCFVRYPVQFERTQNARGDTVYTELVWSKKMVGNPRSFPPIDLGILGLFRTSWWGPMEIHPQIPYPIPLASSEGTLALEIMRSYDKEMGIDCAYSEAALLPGLKPLDARRLEEGRETILKLKIAVLERLAEAVCSQDACDVRSDCLDLLKESLTADDVQFYLRMDQFYLGFPGGSRVHVGRGPRYVPGGLSNLLEVIGHYENELMVGTLHRTREALSGLAGLRGLDSYYDAVTHPSRHMVDKAVDLFLELDRQEDDFWTEYHAWINRSLREEFQHEVTFRVRTKGPVAMVFQRYGQAHLEKLKAHLEAAETLPIPTLEEAAATSAEEPNSFRRQGQSWFVRFDRQLVGPLNDYKGFRYIAYLLERPHRPIPVIAMLIDLKESRPEFEKLLAETRDRMEEDEGLHETDLGEREEIAGLVKQARQAVSAAIRRAYLVLKGHHPELERHLRKYVQLGYKPSYSPPLPIRWLT